MLVAGVPPELEPEPAPVLVPVGVVAVLVVGGVVVPVGVVAVPAVVGAPATETVLVEPPQPPSRRSPPR